MAEPAPPPPLPTSGDRREEQARIEVGHTTVAPATAHMLVAVFLTATALVPLAELASGLTSQDGAAPSAWSHLRRLPLEIGSQLAATGAQGADAGLWDRTIAANRAVLAGLSEFELALEDESALGRTLRPPAQLLLTGWLAAGNERVYAGRDGWLFYRPDVEHVTGPGFLEPAELRRRVASASEWEQPPQPDPRVAIGQLHRDLAARGIELVVMPTPVKPSVHPARLAAGRAGAQAVENPSTDPFVEDLRRRGVLVFDPLEMLAGAAAGDADYLATDTHWRPETMELVAERLAAFLTERTALPPVPGPGHRAERVEVRNRGDIALMLDLPDGSALFPPEPVWLRRVLAPDGSLWRSSRDADVLVLGDSFSNIYALESMGWGTSAGLVEQLSFVLRRPLDRLVQNDAGAYATRAMLQRDPSRLDGKRVVVYQFATRELSFGDWQVLPIDGGAP